MAILSAVLPLVGSAEDLASRALRHVLDSSAHAREAFNELLSFPSGTHWTAQHVLSGEDGAGRPDLAGHSRGQLVGFVEAKFDAGLTDAQPEEYLKALPDNGQLAALVPQVREDYIAAELVRRCQVHGNAVEPRGRQYVVAAPDGSSRWVMRVVTWDEVIAHLLTSTNEPGGREAHDDLVQLEDLVNTIQDRIWTPIAAEQLTSKSTAQLVTQIVDLLGDLRGPLQGKDIQITGPMTRGVGAVWGCPSSVRLPQQATKSGWIGGYGAIRQQRRCGLRSTRNSAAALIR